MAQGTRYTWIYPNITFALSQDSMWIYQAFPLDAGPSHVIQTICFPRASVELADFEQRARHYYDRIDGAIAEAQQEAKRHAMDAETHGGQFVMDIPKS